MKNVVKYCSRCKKSTNHLKKCDHEVGERIILGLVTFGINELNVSNYYECTECGKCSY